VCPCVSVFTISHTQTHTRRHSEASLGAAAAAAHRDDVEEVVIAQRVQDGGDGLPGDGEPQALHAATDVHQDHHVLRGGGRLNVPLPVAAVERDDPVLVRIPFDPLDKKKRRMLCSEYVPFCNCVFYFTVLIVFCYKTVFMFPAQGPRMQMSF